MTDRDYGPWILLVRMWSCVACKTMLCGREHQCPHCLTPRDPDLFLL